MIRGCRAAIALALLLAVPACADEFSEFRIPEHRLFSWTGSVSSRYGRHQSGGNGSSQFDRSMNGGILTSLFWVHDSDPSQTRIDFSGNSSVDRSRTRTNNVAIAPPRFLRTTLESHGTNAGEGLSVAVEQRNYPWRVPLGWQVRLNARGDYRQNWSHQSNEYHQGDALGSSRTILLRDETAWNYRYSAIGELRIGYGRVRDATGVLDARVFEERLLRSGALTRALSATARQRLAAIAYTQYAYSSTHERPAEFEWRAVERVLRDDGALAEGSMSPHDAVRAGEPYIGSGRGSAQPLPSSPVQRATGTFIGPVVTGWHSHSISRQDGLSEQRWTSNDSLVADFLDPSSSHVQSELDEVAAGIRAEFHRPLGLRWQFDASEELVTPLERHREGLQSTADIRMLAIVADRWYAEGFVDHQRRVVRDGGSGAALLEDSWIVSYGANVVFYVEDHVQLRCELSEQQSSTRPTADSSRDLGVTLGVTYRLAGKLSAPGITVP